MGAEAPISYVNFGGFMNLVRPIANTPYAFIYKNGRKRSESEIQQDLNDVRYEGYMRSDFSAKSVPTYVYESCELVRLDLLK